VVPTIIFETSGINALEKGGAAFEPLMRRLQCEFKVILTFASAEELIATPELEKREALFARFERLWRLGAECICPPHEIMRLLISSHSSDPSQFDWRKVGVRTPERRDPEYAIELSREHGKASGPKTDPSLYPRSVRLDDGSSPAPISGTVRPELSSAHNARTYNRLPVFSGWPLSARQPLPTPVERHGHASFRPKIPMKTNAKRQSASRIPTTAVLYLG
jgi:hypothetical protein